MHGPEPWLIVSNDLYLELERDNMLAVPIRDTSRPVPTWARRCWTGSPRYPRTWLIGDEPVAELHPGRHAEVGRRICNLIGP